MPDDQSNDFLLSDQGLFEELNLIALLIMFRSNSPEVFFQGKDYHFSVIVLVAEPDWFCNDYQEQIGGEGVDASYTLGSFLQLLP